MTRAMTTLPAVLAKLAESLMRAGFAGPTTEKSASFGDLVMRFDRSSLEIRFVSDRGQWFLEIRRTGWDDWFDPDTWRACLHGLPIEREPRPLDQQAEFVAGELDDLVIAVDRRFAARTLRKCLEDARAARSHARLGLDE